MAATRGVQLWMGCRAAVGLESYALPWQIFDQREWRSIFGIRF
jgi:hypothetical protein